MYKQNVRTNGGSYVSYTDVIYDYFVVPVLSLQLTFCFPLFPSLSRQIPETRKQLLHNSPKVRSRPECFWNWVSRNRWVPRAIVEVSAKRWRKFGRFVGRYYFVDYFSNKNKLWIWGNIKKVYYIVKCGASERNVTSEQWAFLRGTASRTSSRVSKLVVVTFLRFLTTCRCVLHCIVQKVNTERGWRLKQTPDCICRQLN
jgi:hypothetical protein